MRKRLVIGNWKMNGTVSEALKIVAGLEHHLKTAPELDVVLAPPFTALYSVGVTIQETALQLGAQNCHWENAGAFTGEIAPGFLVDLGCRYVIVGHSERRQHGGETNAQINKKIDAILRNDMIPVVCMGETMAEREANQTWDVLERQTKECFHGLHVKEAEHCAVAYEPVWAIGTGTPATPAQANEAHHFIRNQLEKIFDAPTASAIRIVYGGSVKTDNIEGFAKQTEIDGALVGGASLDANTFTEIVRAMDRFGGTRKVEES